MSISERTSPCPPVETDPDRLAADLEACGHRVLLLYGSSVPPCVEEALRGEGREFRLFEMSGAEPSPLEESVEIGAAICRHELIEVLLVVGGSAALDFAVRVAECFRTKDPSGHGVRVLHLPV